MSILYIARYQADGGVWVAYGRTPADPDDPPPSSGFPSALTAGYVNSGASGTGGSPFTGALTKHNAGFAPEPTGGRLQTAGQTYTHLDFDGGSTYIEADGLTFNGCRFRADWTTVGSETDLALVKGKGATFNNCTFEGTAAPADDRVLDPHGYRVAINAFGNGVKVNRCDLSAFSGMVSFSGSTQADPVEIRDCYAHDAAYPAMGNHTDGIADADSHAGIDGYVVIEGNTLDLKMLNTQVIAFQSGAAGYDHCRIVGNWLAGPTGYTMAEMHNWTNFTVTDNVFSTKYFPNVGDFGALYATSWIAGTNTNWRRNVWEVPAGSPGNAADNGKFLLPDGTLSTTDYTG